MSWSDSGGDMSQAEYETVARSLARNLWQGIGPELRRFRLDIIKLLAKGHPVTPADIGEIWESPPREVDESVSQVPNVEFDGDGNIVGAGLTIRPTPHRLKINGQELFSWCALDTFIFSALLKEPAEVASTCPATRMEIRLSVRNGEVEAFAPATAVVSVVIPDSAEACCPVRSSFCNHVHFFSSPAAASSWLLEHPAGRILTVPEAAQLGVLIAQRLLE